jgi:hypothetical protein
MAMTNKDNPSSPRGDGWGSHADEVAKGARQREVLAETANESPLAFNGTTVEKALQTVAKVSDMDSKDEGATVSAEASQAKIDMAKRLDKEEGTTSSSSSADTDK